MVLIPSEKSQAATMFSLNLPVGPLPRRSILTGAGAGLHRLDFEAGQCAIADAGAIDLSVVVPSITIRIGTEACACGLPSLFSRVAGDHRRNGRSLC